MNPTQLFEYPLSQPFRHFLRVESAFEQIGQLKSSNSHSALMSAVLQFVNLLELLTRVDIKTEIIKELESQTQHYRHLKNNPAVDSQKLNNFLAQLEKLHRWAIAYQGRLGDDLRSQSFIQNIMSKQSLQTGVISCDSPELYYFSKLTIESLQNYLGQWMEKLEGLKTSIQVILRLTRELSFFQDAYAPMGDYLIEKPNPGLSLVRIQVPGDTKLFPEISAGKHRIAIHFYRLSEVLIKKKYLSEVKFQFATCGWKDKN